MKIIDKISLVLIIIGAINWGLIGILKFNLVDTLFGTMSILSRIIYTLVGISGLWGIKLYDEDEDILEDAIIENKQAIEMAKIYSDILNGTMDAYASIISNNLNGVMKFLTSITIVLSIPTMIASFWGMNVRVPMQDNPWGFVIIMTVSVLLGVVATIWLKKKDMLN